jgi:hypothetical protein
MALPRKQVIPNINLTPEKILFQRREELLSFITEDGTFLPKSLLHADLDGGFLEFVKNELKTVIDGKIIPTIDILVRQGFKDLKFSLRFSIYLFSQLLY